MSYRIRNITIAVALAIIAAIMVSFYVSNYRRSVQTNEETVSIYVAARDIPAGTAGAKVIHGAMLERREIARRTVAPGALSDPKQVEGLIAADPIYAGEQVTVRRFTTAEERGIRSQITANERALQLPGDENQLLAGTLKPGDRVDVVASIKYKLLHFKTPGAEEQTQGEELVASRVVLRDLLVLEATRDETGTQKIANPTSSPLSVKLSVTDAQAQKLFFVMRNAEWTLQLRPPDDAADSPESVETVGSVLGDGLKEQQIAQLLTGGGRGQE